MAITYCCNCRLYGIKFEVEIVRKAKKYKQDK
jgi:hypothetical protein